MANADGASKAKLPAQRGPRVFKKQPRLGRRPKMAPATMALQRGTARRSPSGQDLPRGQKKITMGTGGIKTGTPKHPLQ